MVATTIAIAGLALSAIGGITQFVGQQKQASAQKKARNAQLAVENERNRRSRTQALREAQIRRSQAINLGEAVGAGSSSGIAGGVSSLGSQFGSASGHSTMLSGLNADISMHSQKAADAAGLASMGSSIANVGGQLFGNSEKIAGLFPSGGGVDFSNGGGRNFVFNG